MVAPGHGSESPTEATSTTTADAPSGGGPTNTIIVGSLATASGALAGRASARSSTASRPTSTPSTPRAGWTVDEIDLKYQADDTGSPTDDTIQARNLVEQDHVFAVVGVGTPFFTGASFFAAEGTPVFGYVVSQDWNDHPNLFGAYGSYLDYAEVQPGLVDIAKSAESEVGGRGGLRHRRPVQRRLRLCDRRAQAAGVHVGFQDLAFGLGANPTADVLSMKAAHADFLISCMEGSDNLAFDRAMHQNGMTDVHTLWLQGYDRAYLKQDPADMVGAIYLEQHVPFEAAPSSRGSIRPWSST